MADVSSAYFVPFRHDPDFFSRKKIQDLATSYQSKKFNGNLPGLSF